MYTVGFIRRCYPDVLINPVSCRSFAELLKWFNQYVNEEESFVHKEYIIDSFAESLERNKAVTINLANGIALVFAIADQMEKDIHQRVHFN
ncbi:hypothetical protein [Olivibacter sp. XZL3]|uniref:hypothetical protein n=1 Tax=Olivibacter sp. XZL3 TaxID=1735116 RepID=UPI0010646873|nr:hypothetical protein [Olivibacter sp. XZL3]